MTHKIKIAVKGNQYAGRYIPKALNDYYSVWEVYYNDSFGGQQDIISVKAVRWNYTKDEINPKFFENYRRLHND